MSRSDKVQELAELKNDKAVLERQISQQNILKGKMKRPEDQKRISSLISDLHDKKKAVCRQIKAVQREIKRHG